MLKVAKVFAAFTVFELLKILRAAGKNNPHPGLMGLKQLNQLFCGVFQSNCSEMLKWTPPLVLISEFFNLSTFYEVELQKTSAICYEKHHY